MIVTGFKELTEEEDASPDADAIYAQTYVFNEVIVECTAQEINSIVEFLEESRAEYEGISEYGHKHLRDWDDAWKRGESDLIVAFNLDRLH